MITIAFKIWRGLSSLWLFCVLVLWPAWWAYDAGVRPMLESCGESFSLENPEIQRICRETHMFSRFGGYWLATYQVLWPGLIGFALIPPALIFLVLVLIAWPFMTRSSRGG